jgi:hypothetical protein
MVPHRHTTIVSLHRLVFVFTCVESGAVVERISESLRPRDMRSIHAPDEDNGPCRIRFGLLGVLLCRSQELTVPGV